MRGFWIVSATLALGALSAPAGWADVLPPPGYQQQQFMGLITGAGFACAKVASFAPATGAEADGYKSSGLDPFTVRCDGGGTYLVAIPQRRPGPPLRGPDGNPIPLPRPVVKPLNK